MQYQIQVSQFSPEKSYKTNYKLIYYLGKIFVRKKKKSYIASLFLTSSARTVPIKMIKKSIKISRYTSWPIAVSQHYNQIRNIALKINISFKIVQFQNNNFTDNLFVLINTSY